MAGPLRARLDTGLSPANAAAVATAEEGWRVGSVKLRIASDLLRKAAQAAKDVGGDTGPAMISRFLESAELLDDRSDLLKLGQQALLQTKGAIDDAILERNAIDTDAETRPLTPAPYRTPDDFEGMTEYEKQADRQSHSETQAGLVADREAKREEAARRVTERFERRYEAPIETMKGIYGYQEPPQAPTGGGAGGAGPSGGGYTPPTGGGGGGIPTITGVPQNPGTPEPPDPGNPENPEPPGPPDSTTNNPDGGTGTNPGTPTGTPGYPPLTPGSPLGGPGESLPPISTGGPSGGVSAGVLGGVAGGVAGGAALGAIAKNGGLSSLLGKGSLSSRGVAPIGGSTKGSSGVLGRSGGAPTGGRSAAGAGAGRGGTATGGRGAGGRGAGGRGGAATGRGAGGGRGGKSKSGKKGADQDLFDDGEDWLDDEGAGPAVLG